MRDVAPGLGRKLGFLLLALFVAGCGAGTTDSAANVAGQAPAGRFESGSPVETEEAALAAVRAHLFRITSCQTARDQVEEDFAAGKFAARQVFGYQTQNPLWEVEVAGDLHIPYLYWYVEQGDGTVLPSIAAATYYQSPLLHLCGQIYAVSGLESALKL